jgi:hypothetical protein
MRTFRPTEKIEFVCDSDSTRSGFKHTARLIINGNEVESTKICYLNRTWERYEYQSVIHRLIEKSKVLSDEEKKICNEWAKGDHTDWSGFRMVSQIAKLGEVLCDNQKDKNAWKERMLRAGFENRGLSIPEDWDTLDEDTKQARLDKVLEFVGEVGK